MADRLSPISTWSRLPLPCQGTTGTVYDPKYPSCIKYNCPAAYPVVWCALNGGHVNTSENGINYQQAIWPFFMSLPPTP